MCARENACGEVGGCGSTVVGDAWSQDIYMYARAIHERTLRRNGAQQHAGGEKPERNSVGCGL